MRGGGSCSDPGAGKMTFFFLPVPEPTRSFLNALSHTVNATFVLKSELTINLLSFALKCPQTISILKGGKNGVCRIKKKLKKSIKM